MITGNLIHAFARAKPLLNHRHGAFCKSRFPGGRSSRPAFWVQTAPVPFPSREALGTRFRVVRPVSHQVGHVLRVGAPCQIGRMIVCWIPVEVSHLVLRARLLPVKHGTYNAMSIHRDRAPTDTEVHQQMPPRMLRRTERPWSSIRRRPYSSIFIYGIGRGEWQPSKHLANNGLHRSACPQRRSPRRGRSFPGTNQRCPHILDASLLIPRQPRVARHAEQELDQNPLDLCRYRSHFQDERDLLLAHPKLRSDVPLAPSVRLDGCCEERCAVVFQVHGSTTTTEVVFRQPPGWRTTHKAG